MVVRDDSKELLTINTHRGLYRYNRLPFGVKCATAFFQQIIDSMLTGLHCAMAYLDDNIVVSSDVQEHYAHLSERFNRMKSYGFCVCPQKCTLMIPNITYMGSLIGKDGRRPDQ